MSFRTGLLAALILASGCAGPLVLDNDNALVVIPHQVGTQGQIIVQVRINGQGPFKFALDTGASISVLFDRTRQRAGLGLMEDDKVLVHGMVGFGEFPIAAVDLLEIGGEHWANPRIASIPASKEISADFDGILGIDFLRKYVVGVSASEQVVRLYSPLLVRERSYFGWTSVPMRQFQTSQGRATLYSIDLLINGITIPAMLDLGTGANLMSLQAAQMINARPRRPQSKTQLSGMIAKSNEVAELKVERLGTGALYWHNKSFLVSAFPIFDVLGLGNMSVAIVGPNLFSNRDFVIDFDRMRLLVAMK